MMPCICLRKNMKKEKKKKKKPVYPRCPAYTREKKRKKLSTFWLFWLALSLLKHFDPPRGSCGFPIILKHFVGIGYQNVSMHSKFMWQNSNNKFKLCNIIQIYNLHGFHN